ncbi:NACHT domain-containing protein [Streptomyces sp. NPDC058620]|uniref:NACHT domain-containing protein n=1 Tax=Streptomyces sp. NPDC058620 TaxID=3346560 RepID=UPI003658D3E8
MTNEVFTVQAPRWCRVRPDSSPDGDFFPLDDDGFLGSEHIVAPLGSEATAGLLVAPGDVACEGVTVLLGEPGAGKTSVFRLLVQGLPMWDDTFVPDGADRCVWVDGPDLTAATWDEVLGSHLRGLPSVAVGQGLPPSGNLTVVIDQADESELCRHLPSYLKRCLKNRDVRGLRLLLACRTGDYPSGLTSVFREAFGGCSLVDLAPLSRSDAVALVESAGVGGEQLISEVVALRAGALASVPLTLELIVREYRAHGCLRGGAKELFEDSVRLLSQEYDPDRLTVAAPATTWPQRLEVAGRIAARLVLSGRRTLWRGSPREDRPRTTDLDVSTLSGGSEQTSGCQTFEVTPTVVDEVLSSGLFTASGNHRFAFRHSSLAAFLTAQHLISRSVPDTALRRLFLVEAPDQEAAGIPVSLRESAAWLVALDPDRTSWLASADPESLTMHSGLVRSDDVRELIVRRLLERAADVELGEARWHQTRWALGHPGLAGQLAPALALDPADFGDWETRAQAQVAIHLAKQCPSPGLAPLLLKVAADPRWPADNRANAARAAFACDGAVAAPVLKEVLATLGPGKETDPGLRLRGALLTLLWPRFLDTKMVLDALSEAPSDDRYGAYEHFLAEMPAKCPAEDVHRIVAWLAQDVEAWTSIPDGRRKPFAEDRLVSGTVDRALSVPGAELLLPDIARILTVRILGHEKAEFPHVLNPFTPDGLEPVPVRDLRRKLAAALLSRGIAAGQTMRYFGWLVVREWQSPRPWFGEPEGSHGDRHKLLDSGDFAWALQTAADCAEQADAYAQLAKILFDQGSQEHFELAYESQDNPAWPYLRWFYEPIEIRGDFADNWRRIHRASSPPTWPESAKFIARQRERLQRARQHDTDSFWALLWDLQIDPNTGKGQHRFDDKINDWPGRSVFTAEELADLPCCALRFLRLENDHADEWLGLDKRDKRAWAGVLSLSLLDDAGRLDDLEPDRWSAWVGAIADPWYVLSSTTWALLLQRAAVNDPQGLARAVGTAARVQLAHGVQPLVLERIEATWSSVVTEIWEEFLATLSAALLPDFRSARPAGAWSVAAEAFEKGEEGRAALVRTWSGLLAGLLAVENTLARSVAEFALMVVERDGEAGDHELPVLAACVLVEVDGFEAWTGLRELIDASARFSRDLALKCAGRSERGHVEVHADEEGLSALYRWLNTVFPQDRNSRPLGVHTVTPEMEALDWREALPGTLSRRGTPEAVDQLKALAAEFPARLNLRAALVSARANCLAATWTPVDLDEVVALLAGIAASSESLLVEARLVDVLESFQDMGSHEFRGGIVRDMQRLMNSDRLLLIADHKMARDHLRAIAGYAYGAGGPEARLALLTALEQARPDEKAVERLRDLLAVRESWSA